MLAIKPRVLVAGSASTYDPGTGNRSMGLERNNPQISQMNAD
jgi:hypothetical protein